MFNTTGSAHRRSSLPALLLLLSALCGAPPLSGQGLDSGSKFLYRWTDSAGQAHFSDRPPVGSVEGLSVQEVTSFAAPPAEDGATDYSVESQARRLEEQRLAREAARQETRRQREEQALRKAQLEAAKEQAEAARAQREAAEGMGPDGYPVYVRPQPPWWPPVRSPHPTHPRSGGERRSLRLPAGEPQSEVKHR